MLRQQGDKPSVILRAKAEFWQATYNNLALRSSSLKHLRTSTAGFNSPSGLSYISGPDLGDMA